MKAEATLEPLIPLTHGPLLDRSVLIFVPTYGTFRHMSESQGCGNLSWMRRAPNSLDSVSGKFASPGGVGLERAVPVGIDLAGPFDGMFTLNSADATIAVNWGIAAVVYLIVGAVVAWLIALIGTARLRQRSAVTT